MVPQNLLLTDALFLLLEGIVDLSEFLSKIARINEAAALGCDVELVWRRLNQPEVGQMLQIPHLGIYTFTFNVLKVPKLRNISIGIQSNILCTRLTS